MQGGRKNRVGNMNNENGTLPGGAAAGEATGSAGGESFVAIHGLSFGAAQQSQNSKGTIQQQQQQMPSVVVMRGPQSKLSVFDVESAPPNGNAGDDQLLERNQRDGGAEEDRNEQPEDRSAKKKKKHRTRGHRENMPEAESTRIEVQTLDPPVSVIPASNSAFMKPPRPTNGAPRAAVSTSVPIDEPPITQSSLRSSQLGASASAALDFSATRLHSHEYGAGVQNPAFVRREERLEMESVESDDGGEMEEGHGTGRERDSGLSQSRARSAGTASENSELREVPLAALYTNQHLPSTSTPKETSGSRAAYSEAQPVAAASVLPSVSPSPQILKQSGTVSRDDRSRFLRL